jgi:signal transduction histidine kinase
MPAFNNPGALRRVNEAVDRGLRGAMHAMAQPLTVLQSRVEAALLLSETSELGVELLHTIAEEVDRLCALLHPLQFLVTARSHAEATAPTTLHQLLGSVFEDVRPLFDESGVTLSIDVQMGMPQVMIDAKCTRESLLMTLLAARSISSAGDAVEAGACLNDGAVEVRVHASGPRQAPLSAPFELNMALAEARTLGQQGEFSLTLHPYHVCIRLPLAAVC